MPTPPDDFATLPGDIDETDPVFQFITGVAEVLASAEDLDPQQLRAALAEVVARVPEPPRALGLSPAVQAQNLMVDAWDDPEDGTAKALDALRLDVNCADAWVYLAYDAGEELELAFVFYTVALMAAFDTLGQGVFEAHAGSFWSMPETRPFMRALEGVARTNWDLGETEAAAMYFSEMLRLNPNDDQGARYPRLCVALEQRDSESVHALLEAYAEDSSVVFTYGAALNAFQQSGDTPVSQQLLAKAIAGNPHMAPYLSKKLREFPDVPDFYTPGSEEEARTYLPMMAEAWETTPGAAAWIRKHTGAPAPAARPSAPAKAKRSGPRRAD